MDPVQPQPAPSANSRFSMEYGSSSPIKKYLLWLAFGIIALIIYTWVNSPMVVTVTGVGDVSVPASNATLSFTVNGTGASAADSVNAVKAKVENIKNLLLNSGIAEGDIVEAQPQVIPASTIVQGASGFQAGITMGAKTVHVGDTATLVSNLYASGASLVSQPVLSVENQQDLEQQAYDAALKDAKSQASKIGLKSFKFIRKIVAVSQSTSPTVTTVTSKADTTLTQNQGEVAEGVFKLRKTLAVSFKMW